MKKILSIILTILISFEFIAIIFLIWFLLNPRHPLPIIKKQAAEQSITLPTPEPAVVIPAYLNVHGHGTYQSKVIAPHYINFEYTPLGQSASVLVVSPQGYVINRVSLSTEKPGKFSIKQTGTGYIAILADKWHLTVTDKPLYKVVYN